MPSEGHKCAEKVNHNTVTRDSRNTLGEFVSEKGNASLAFLINPKESFPFLENLFSYFEKMFPIDFNCGRFSQLARKSEIFKRWRKAQIGQSFKSMTGENAMKAGGV